MTYSGALTVLESHLTAAGTAITPNITDVGAGEPGIPTTQRAARYWYMGESDPPHFPGGRTFTDEIVGERVMVQAYWASASRDKPLAAKLETEVQAWVRAIRNRLIGDRTLGGNCVDTSVGRATAGWLDLDGARWRVASLELILEFVDIDTIAP